MYSNSTRPIAASRPSLAPKDELLTKRYVLDKPDKVYPLDGLLQTASNSNSISNTPIISNVNSLNPPRNTGSANSDVIYPDFKPWIYSEEEDVLTNGHLQKGFYEPPVVNNEYISARNIMSSILVEKSLVEDLSNYMIKAINLKELNNKISPLSSFKPPPRVTLTEQKKEQWLKDLSNPSVSLKKLSRTIPHGIRNRVLLDQLILKNVPISRAIWLTKCICINELRSLKRKNSNNDYAIELNWIQDWTQQILEYLERFAKEMNPIATHSNSTSSLNIALNSTINQKDKFKYKLNYLVSFISQLYLEKLIDREYFLKTILNFLRYGINSELNPPNKSTNSDSNYEVKLIGIIFLKIYWENYLKIDYLSKELSDILLLNYYFISKENKKISAKLKEKILLNLKDLIVHLFKFNSNSFIIPNNWILLQPTLYKILKELNNTMIMQQFELISYRNESLMLNSNNTHLSSNQMKNPNVNLIKHLDNLELDDGLKELLSPTNSPNVWQKNLKTTIMWSISKYVNDQSSVNILIISNFLKKVYCVLSKTGKIEFENEILEIIYNLHDCVKLTCLNKLYVLINELYQLKFFKISSYLRKLISSGILYLNTDEESNGGKANNELTLHINVLKNLPLLNNNQSNMILKKINDEINYELNYNKGKQILNNYLINGLILGNDTSNLSVEDENYLKDLEVGIKFLLINWTTNEIKSRINKSDKLIHINLTKLSKLYKVYLEFHNLTCFYKDLLRFLLMNENKLIIIYLDSLYLILNLIFKNFKLVELIGNFEPLVRLSLNNYNDLRNHDVDYFNFNKYWKLILNIIDDDDGSEKIARNSVSNSSSNAPTVTGTTGVSSNGSGSTLEYLNDSPVKNKEGGGIIMRASISVGTPTTTTTIAHQSSTTTTAGSNPPVNELSDHDKLIGDLNYLVSENSKFYLTNRDILEFLNDLNLKLPFYNENINLEHEEINLFENCEYLLGVLFNQDIPKKDLNEDDMDIEIDIDDTKSLFNDESDLIKVYDEVKLIKLLRTCSSNVEFNTTIEVVMNKLILTDDAPDKFDSILKFCVNLINYELIDLYDLIGIFNRIGKLGLTIIYKLLFEEFNDLLNDYQLLKLQFERDDYEDIYNEDKLMLIIDGILNDKSVGIFDSYLMMSYQKSITFFIAKMITRDFEMVMNKFVNNPSISRHDVILFVNELLYNDDEGECITGKEQLNKVIENLDEFNLSLYQILIKVVFEMEFNNKDINYQTEELTKIFHVLLNNFKNYKSKNLNFGELFKCINVSYRSILLNECEVFFLDNDSFPHIVSSNGEINLIPIVKDFVKRIIISSNKIDTTPEFFYKLSHCLVKLIKICEDFENERIMNNLNYDQDEIYDCIYIFLRILIIHKQSIRSILVNDEMNFINNLIKLLKLKFVDDRKKLKILLYDILLLIKVSITELNPTSSSSAPLTSNPSETSNIRVSSTVSTFPGSSPINQPTPVTNPVSSLFSLPKIESANPLRSLLDDSENSYLIDETDDYQGLYLYNKSTKKYSKFRVRPFDLLEDSNPVPQLNDTPINLHLFDAHIKRQNPA